MMRDDYDDLRDNLVIMGCQCRRIDRDYYGYILLLKVMPPQASKIQASCWDGESIHNSRPASAGS